MSGGVSFWGGSDDGMKTKKWGFVCSDYQLEDFFVCVETDGSLEMRDEIGGLRRFRLKFKQEWFSATKKFAIGH